MNKKIFLTCLFLLLPFGVLTAGHSINEADLAAYKELSQARTDALKESLQKDIQAQTAHIEQQQKLLDSFSSRIGDLSTFLTVFGLVAGLLGYFTVSSRAKNEARIAASEWMEKEGQNAIDVKLKDLDSHIATQKEAVTARLEKLYADAALPLAEQQKQLNASQPSMESSTQEQIFAPPSDALSQLVEALKYKPEAEYGFDDLNVRAHDAYAKGNFALAAEYWLQAARGGKARAAQVAQSLHNACHALYQLKRNTEAIAVCDDLVSRYGNDPEVTLREVVAGALVIKGITLGQAKRSEEAIAIFDDVESRYGNAPEVALRGRVSQALVNKGATLGRMQRREEAIAVFDDVESRYGNAPEVALRASVGLALVNKGITLGKLNRSGEEIAVYDEVVSRYGGAPEVELRENVARAMNGKGFALLCRAKANWGSEFARLADLRAAAILFAQAEKGIDKKSMVQGNQAYTAFLLGQEGVARSLLKQALQKGAEKLYEATLSDLEIYPVAIDDEFRTLLEDIWRELKQA
jgi:tetratricopeptide (TPR) repeat protein